MTEVDDFYQGIEEAEDGISKCMKALREAGADIADDPLAQRLRRIREDIGEARDRVESYGLVDSDED